MQQFTTADFRRLGVCRSGLARVEAFGGAIENTLAGWQAYIDANPDAWTAPVFTAWTLHRRDVIDCPDLVWQIARIAFREQRNPVLRVFADTLGPENWRDAYAYADADAADAAAAAAAYADAAAAYADADAAYAAAAAAAAAAYAYAAAAYADADAAYAAAAAAAYAAAAAAAYADAAAAAAARSRVKGEIVALAVAALRTVAAVPLRRRRRSTVGTGDVGAAYGRRGVHRLPRRLRR